ncbi:Rid family hydrolase [Microbacterium gorillae]|uniref:Rid family hydrolase n=1 Tax=Microbacterium gorillae TaxID=1231063 RepID=UPI00058D9D6B|nr:Rid family hydrolase [Microbacterium gorillae]
MAEWRSFFPEGLGIPCAASIADDTTIYVSGVGGHAMDGSISEDTADQTRQSLAIIADLLAREGSSLDEVVWMQPYVVDIADAEAVAAVISETFGDAPPASGAMVGNVALAEPRMKMELQVTARRGAKRVRVQ